MPAPLHQRLIALAFAVALAILANGAVAGEVAIKSAKVYYEPGRFGGWPANHGMWAWGNELLVGFGRGYHQDRGASHNIDHDKPEEHVLARSLDGGETWSIEDPAANGALIPAGEQLFGITRPDLVVPEATDCPGDIDFTHADFCMTTRMFCSEAGHSQFFYSYDRGRSWKGPYRLAVAGVPGVNARTNYIVNGKHDCTLFLSTSTMELPVGGTGQRPFCARTADGGKTWAFVSWIGPPVEGNAIMPAVARTSDRPFDPGLLCILRRRVKPKAWLAACRSNDDGATWEALADPVDDLGLGNPPSLIRLADGAMCLTYGVRKPPFRMSAKLSRDNGRTWSEEIVLRDDGATHDMGYPRSAQRPDGKVVTVYYFCDKTTGPERYIGATIWDPKGR